MVRPDPSKKPPAKKVTPRKATKPTKATKAPAYVSEYVNCKSETAKVLSQLLIEIIGGPGTGKTWVALSASKYWPKEPAAIRTKHIELLDVCHVAWDAAALAGVKAAKIKPRYEVNVPSLMAKQRKSGKPKCADICEAIEVVIDEVGNICAVDTNVCYVIDDTWSRLDHSLQSFWFHDDNVFLNHNETEEDGRRTWGRILRDHRRYFTMRMELPDDVTNIINFHGRVEDTGAQAKKDLASRRNVLQLADDVWIVPQISGQAGGLLLGDASVVFAMINSKAPKGKPSQRHLYTVPSQGMYTKNRFQQHLAEKEKPDLNYIINKLEKACK